MLEYITLAVESEKFDLIENTRLKISEWLDFGNTESYVIVTVYLEFSRARRPQDLHHLYIVISKSDSDFITLPEIDEIRKENEALRKTELSRIIDAKGRYIQPISVKDIFLDRQSEEFALIRIDLGEFDTDDLDTNRLQFCFHIRNSFRKSSWLSTFVGSSWDWSYEASLHPLIMDDNEFADVIQPRMDLELWVMVEPTMYDSVSDLNIQSTRPFDRLVILPEDIAEKLEKNPGTLCIRWFFPEFSESALGAEIIVSKKRSLMEREIKYVEKINSDPNYIFLAINRILNDSRVTCVDFKYISSRLEKPEFSRLLDILFQLLYHRNDTALSKMNELVNILEGFQELKYGRYYYHMYRLLHQMRNCESIQDIIMPSITKLLEEFLCEPESVSRTITNVFEDLKHLIDLVEHFYYYNNPEDKYKQKKEILIEIAKSRDIAKYKLTNPESYLITEEILLKWEFLVEKEFEQFAGIPRLNVELRTKRVFFSENIYLIFDVTNVSDVPMINLTTRLLPSEQYDVLEFHKRNTHVRKRLTKSDTDNKRVFSPEYVVIPKEFPKIRVQLEIKFFTEEGKNIVGIFEKEIELFREEIRFKRIDSNPYIVGSPVKTEKMFYGRKEVFRQIHETILGSKLVNQAMIYGQHRIGKTSVLYQLMNVLRGTYITVLAPMHRFERGDSELLHFWSTQIATAIRDRTNEEFKIPNYDKLSSPYKGFQEFLEKIIRELEGTRIIFMIDEYSLIDDFTQDKEIDKEIFRVLDWIIKHNSIRLVMVGRLPLEDLKTEEWMKIARTFVQTKLGPLSEEEARGLIVQPIETCLRYDDSAIEKILRLTNCHPYLIQLCCHAMVDYHNSERKTTVSYSEVEERIPGIIELGNLALEDMILKDTTEEEKAVLQVMATWLEEQTSISEEELVVRISKHNPGIKDKDIKNALSNLEKREVIRQVTEEMRRYKFVYDLFRYWVLGYMEPPPKSSI